MKYNANHQQYEHLGAGYDYFKPALLPQFPTVTTKKIAEPTQMVQNDYIEILYIESGNGTLICDGIKYTVYPDFYCVFLFYNFHQIIPASNTSLDIVSITMDYRFFIYIYTMLYDYEHWMNMFQKFIMTYMSNEDNIICKKIIHKLLHSTENTFWNNLEKINGVTEIYTRILRKSLMKD